MNIKKITAKILICCMLYVGLGIDILRPTFALNKDIYSSYKASIESKYTESERQIFKNKIESLLEYKGRNESKKGTLYASDISLEQILYYLVEYKGIKIEIPDNPNRKINPYVYKKYKVVAYEDISLIMKNQSGHGSFERVDTSEGKEIEYRYLGYTKESIAITNDFYPADFNNGTDPLSRTYRSTSDAKKSWEYFMKNEPHYGQIYQLMNTNLKNDDTTEGVYRDVGYTAFDLLGLNGFPDSSNYLSNKNVKVAQSKMIMMQFPSLSATGQFKLIHGANRKYYDTFRTQDMTLSADVKIKPAESVYFVEENQDEIVIEYQVISTINKNATTLPYKNGLNILKVAINSDGDNKIVFNNPTYADKDLEPSLEATFKKVIKVTDLNLSKGKDTVTLTGSSDYIDMTNYLMSFTAKPVKVEVNALADFVADFTIHNKDSEDVTDGVMSVKDVTFKTPYTVTLKDASATSKGNIISRIWKLKLKNGTEKIISKENEKEVTFQITAANKENILHEGNKIIATLDVKTDQSNKIESVVHNAIIKRSAAPQPTPSGPVAIIKAKLKQNSNDDYITMEGKVFGIHGRESYHPEGLKLIKYHFETNGGYTSSDGGKKNDYIYYLESGKYYPKLTVTDEKGGQDTDTTCIRVRPAEFNPIIEVSGNLKENRKVTFKVKNQYNLKYFPIEKSSLDWTITPLEGQGDVICIDGSADNKEIFDAIFKKKGSYKITVSGNIYNGIKRYKGTASTKIVISEDLPPVISLKVSTRLVRDIKNKNMTKLIIYGESYSPDGDIIIQKKYWYRYDEDNDGDFSDTDWILLSAGNFDKMIAYSDQVGRYEFKIEVKEKFGQPTIHKFIKEHDYKRGDTDNQLEKTKISEIINIAPTVTMDIVNKKPVTLIAYHDYNEAELTDLKNKLEILKAQLLNKQLKLNIEYLTPTENVGSRTHYPVYRETFINLEVYREGWDEDNDEYRYTETVRLLLDSQATNETGHYKSQKGRFTIISSELEPTYHSGPSYKDKNRYKVYIDKYRNLKVTYRDNWKNKTYTKTYKFITDFLYLSYISNVENELESKEEYLVNTKLVEDAVITKEETYYYNDFDAPLDPKYTSYTRLLSIPRNLDSSVINLKHFSQSDLNNILTSTPAGEEMFFINVCNNMYNQLTFDNNFIEMLKSKNITYMSTNKDKLRINPLTGNYDEIVLGNTVMRFKDTSGYDNHKYEKERIVKVGDIAYRLDELTGEFIALGDFESQYSNNKLDATSNVEIVNNYSKSLEQHESGWDDFQNEYANGYWKYMNQFLTDYFKPDYYNTVSSDLKVTTDGHLTTKKYYNHYKGKLYYNYPSFGDGYIGELKNISYKYQTYGGTKDLIAKGFVHNDGNIYFKEGNGKFNYSFKNGLVITEGFNNIEKIVQLVNKDEIYIYTDTKVVKYNTKTKLRTVVVENFIRRVGTSVEIEANKWVSFDKEFKGYKFVAYNEGEFLIRYKYKKNRYATERAFGSTKLYIDMDDNYWMERDYYVRYYSGKKYYTIDKTSKTLLGTDVKELPFIDVLDEIPIGDDESLSGVIGSGYKEESSKPYMYTGNDGYLYAVPNLEKAFSLTNALSLDAPNPKARPESYGKVKKIDIVTKMQETQTGFASWTSMIYPFLTLESYSNGVLGFDNGTNGISQSNLKTFSFATLNEGDPKDIVSESQLVGVTHLSNSFATVDALIEGIYNAYDNYSSSNTIYVELGNSIDATTTFEDYENDEAYSQVYDFVHVNPNYFENSLGKDPNAGTGLLKPLTQFNYVGHYEVNPKVKDNPKPDDRFDNYRLTNNDESKINVYVHRPPFAFMNYRFGESHIPGYFTLTCEDSGSYDLDHESEAAKGIINWKFGIKNQDKNSWTIVNQKTFTHSMIIPNMTYETFFMVQDKEKAWSKPVYKSFKLEEIPVNIDAKVKARDKGFSIGAMPITEFFNIYDIETEYPKELQLEIALYDEETRVSDLITVPFSEGVSATTDAINQNLVKWDSVDLQVPSTLADKEYTLKVVAVDKNNSNRRNELNFLVGVKTPINPIPTIPQIFIADEEIELLCKTSKYTDAVDVKIFTGTTKESSYSMKLKSVDTKYKIWTIKYTVPKELNDGTYNAIFTGIVNTIPAKKERATINFEYITLKIISAVMYPHDPMAGDELIWVIESIGGVDKYEVIFEKDIIDNDERASSKFGYEPVKYPYFIEVDESVNKKSDELKYILWCTTPQSKTLKGIRNRKPYKFIVRAWKGKSFVDIEFEKEIIGDTRELLKVGF